MAQLLSSVCLFATPWTVAMAADSSVHGIFQARILEWVAISLLQEIFLTQGSNLDLLHCRQILYHLSYEGLKSPCYQMAGLTENGW